MVRSIYGRERRSASESVLRSGNEMCGSRARTASQDSDAVIGRGVARWWVLHTRARTEKVVAATLAKNRVRHYLPLVHVQRTYGHRRSETDIPLFPGYLFVHGDSGACDAAWKTNKIAQVLHVENQGQIHAELGHIRRLMESGAPVDLYPSLRQGRHCRIRCGGLRGIEGVVLRRRNRCRMYISATILGQSAMIEIDAALLESLD